MKPSYVHIWLGTTSLTPTEYDGYFTIPYTTTEERTQEVTNKNFATDLGVKFYDEDFLIRLPLEKKNVKVEELIEDLAVDRDEIEKVVAAAQKKGVKVGNTGVSLDSHAVDEQANFGNDLSIGLVYLGEFLGEF